MSENKILENNTFTIKWSCIFCRKYFFVDFIEYPNIAWNNYKDAWEKAILNDIEQHMYIEVKEYMMSKNQYPNEEKAFYILSKEPENILKYVDNYQEFKKFCYNKRMAERLMDLSKEQML